MTESIYSCVYCLGSGLVFARNAEGYLYVFKHACNSGNQRKENVPFWKAELLKYYEPESNT